MLVTKLHSKQTTSYQLKSTGNATVPRNPKYANFAMGIPTDFNTHVLSETSQQNLAPLSSLRSKSSQQHYPLSGSSNDFLSNTTGSDAYHDTYKDSLKKDRAGSSMGMYNTTGGSSKLAAPLSNMHRGLHFYHENNRSDQSILDETLGTNYFQQRPIVQPMATVTSNSFTSTSHKRNYFSGMGTTSTRHPGDSKKSPTDVPLVHDPLHYSNDPLLNNHAHNTNKSKKRPIIRKLEADSNGIIQYNNNMIIMNNQSVPVAFTTSGPTGPSSNSGSNTSGKSTHFPKLGQLSATHYQQQQKKKYPDVRDVTPLSGLTKMATNNWNATNILPHMSNHTAQSSYPHSGAMSLSTSLRNGQQHQHRPGNQEWNSAPTNASSTSTSQQRLSIVVPGDELLSPHVPPSQQTYYNTYDLKNSNQEKERHQSASKSRVNVPDITPDSGQKENQLPRLNQMEMSLSPQYSSAPRKRKSMQTDQMHHHKRHSQNHNTETSNSQSHHYSTQKQNQAKSTQRDDDNESTSSVSSFSRQNILPDHFNLCSPSAVYECWATNDADDAPAPGDISTFNSNQKALLLKIHEELDALDQFLEEQKRLRTPSARRRDPYDILDKNTRRSSTKHIFVNDDEEE